MTGKNLKELRSLTTEELIQMKEDISNNVRSINFKMKIEKPKNIMEKRNLRRKIAVINTIIRERELAESKR